MPTFWDTVCKVFVRDYPLALLRLFNPSSTFVRAHPTELKEVDLHLDSLLEVVSHGQHMLLYVEFQTANDAIMAERLLRYNVITRMQQKLPVLSCVLYLLPDGQVPASPLRWHAPGRKDLLVFAFESIQVSHLLPEDVMRMDSIELLTLLPLTHGGATQQMIEYMLQRFRQHGDERLEVISFAFALLAVRNDKPTSDWLRKRFSMIEDLFEDDPMFEGIKERAFTKGEQQGEQKGALNSLRETTTTLIDQRFPSLHEIAQQQIALVEDPHTLQTMIVHLALVSTLEEAHHTLLSWQD
jgi:hypothetical protein